MELGGREILIALGALLIVAILLDGFRRVRRAGEGKLRVKRRKQPIFEDDGFDTFGSELPNGKARVVAFRDEDSAEQLSQTIKANRAHHASKLTAPFRQTKPPTESLESRPESDSAAWEDESDADRAMEDVEKVEPDGLPVNIDAATREGQISLFGEEVSPFGQDETCEAKLSITEEDDSPIDEPLAKADKKSRNSRAPRETPLKTRASQSAAAQNKSAARAKQADIDDDVVILHLMAEQGQAFQGNDLLKAVVDNGLRYGSLKIFHRHVREDGSGDILFSMANSVNPGTFELNAMGEFSTPGVSFMMVLGDSDDPLDTFDLMLECIHGINSAIGGELKDQQRSALSQQTAEHYRQRIMDFNRRRLAAGV